MKDQVFFRYISAVMDLFASGEAREESFYSILEKFIFEMGQLVGCPGLKIIIMPKRTNGGNPDFVIKDTESNLIGYIEAKEPLKKLGEVEKTNQIKRYIEVFPNFILTNFYEFWFYRRGQCIDTVNIISLASLKKKRISVAELINKEECMIIFREYLGYQQPMRLNARGLARELANRTRFMRDYVVLEELQHSFHPDDNNKENYLLGFFYAFKRYLLSDLNEKEFADLYSQTLSFGLITAAAKCHQDKKKFSRENAIHYIPFTNGILHDLFQFISLGRAPVQLQCIMDEMVYVLNCVNINRILNEYFLLGKGEDPIHHFYETFLEEYDPQVREKRGVYYTPRSIVHFIVTSIDWVLKEKLKFSEGLANPGIKVLDLAAGTATFLAEAAQLAINYYTEKYGDGMQEAFIRNYLLKNLYGFELMMAPYAVAYLKMGYILEMLGGRLEKDERFNIFLTNTLDMDDIETSNLPGMATLSRESRRAAEVKKSMSLTVIMGNPPYAGHSQTRSTRTIQKSTLKGKIRKQKMKTWIGEKIDAYKMIDEKVISEKNFKWLQDDYVKFIRFAQVKIEETGEGVVGLITNHAYLDNPTFRGMRYSLLKTFNEIYILNLHGNAMKKERCPADSVDENVFDIRQGVAISIFIKKKKGGDHCCVFYADFWGNRVKKYDLLGRNNINTLRWKKIYPKKEFYLFVPTSHNDTGKTSTVYKSFIKITEIFPVYSVGIVTARDKLTINRDKKEMFKRLSSFANGDVEKVRKNYSLGNDTRDWQVKEAQKDVRESGIDEGKIFPILYRPFDKCYTYYTGKSRGFLCMPRPKVMKHMLKENIGIITVRQVAEGHFNHCFVADTLVESRVTSSNKGIAYLFPIYIYLDPDNPENNLFSGQNNHVFMRRQANLNPQILNLLLKFKYKFYFNVRTIFHYIYAILFSTQYREKYAEQLKIDFPRIPFTSDGDLFSRMAYLGKQLIMVHLMNSPELHQTHSKFEVGGDNMVRKAQFKNFNTNIGRVYINKSQYFSNISEQVWKYNICGYQVMEKWLKSRFRSKLSFKDVTHYIKMSKCMELTIQYQKEIDQIYPGIESQYI